MLIISPVHDKLYMYQCYYMRSPGTSPVMLQCTSGSTDGQTKGLIQWISPRPAQTSRPKSKHSIGCIMFFTLCPMDTRAYGQHQQYFSPTEQYQHLFLSDRTVSAFISLRQDSIDSHGSMRYYVSFKQIISLSGTIHST